MAARFQLTQSWRGKAIGAAVGIFAAGPVGAAIGALLGHFYDQQASEQPGQSVPAPSLSVQETFFRATFQVMGHVAKADGRVSEADITAARAMMTTLRLGEPEVRFAQDLYREGKSADFRVTEVLQQLAKACADRPDLKRMFVQVQLQTALHAGAIPQAARKTIARACELLGVPTYELLQMEALLRMQSHASSKKVGNRASEAYEVLGVAATATDAEVTKAYRRLMNENHPDKLIAKGLPESMMKLAEEKTRQIRAAYDVVRESRGMR